ncbi:ATP-dependent RNA helicase TDRD9 isoform X2 [Tympanuchus pallidicinctus]|uniref:ATP-dependent RNA helicase TDRD9 isoform X2 n=1 Tax=Tympanuchus pallidicinctus TaxID=109042 RepID=UPI0022875844|nr:ATP-dependent RNA helicase TDRD9 isoform X2 [Tympanuchus pallidicinctus]
MGHVLWAGLSLAREESAVRGRGRTRVLCGARRWPVVAIMLRNLTIEQVNEWFTIGKDVTAVEFLGDRAQATASRDSSCLPSPFAVQESLRLPVPERSETKCAEKYRQVGAQKRDAPGNDLFVCEQDASMSNCEPCVWNSISMTTNHKYACMPVARHREELLSLIKSNSVVIIQGATGSGKSTQVPQYVLDYCTEQSVYCNIAVTQPRKIGASSIARWISKERSWTLGGFVGYQVGLENISSTETRLLYMTTGVLLQKVVTAKSLTEFTHIFIDEVHERTEEMDFLLLVIRKLLHTNSQSVKIILMSATINCEEIADYFAIPTQNGLNPACIFKVEGKPYAVKEYYLDDLKHIVHFQLPSQRIDKPMIGKEIYEVAVSLIQSFDELEMQCNGGSFTPDRGSVLVFLPGFSEIRYMHSRLTCMFNKKWQVYPLHSRVSLEEQNNVFLNPVPGYRKVILSTNIAESSVTVPDVKYVIDFCLTRTLVCDEETNYQSLRLCWASKANCYQRRGRAGRVSNGYCYRLVHKDFWTDSIPEKSLPEMLTCPLGTTVLKIKKLNMGEPKALLATALSPPNISDIERTILHLKELGALTSCVQAEENLHDGELTFLGNVLVHLPVDLHLGKLIVLGHVFGCLEECLIIAAALSLQNFFIEPFKQPIDGYRSKLFFSGNSKSDCIAIVNAFKAWQMCRQNGDLRHPKDELEWGQLNYVHIKKVREVAELIELLKERVKQFNMHVNTQLSAMDQEYAYKQHFILQVVMAGAFYPNYFSFQKCNEQGAVRELGGKDPKTTVLLKNIPPYGYLYHNQLQSQFRQCGQVKSVTYDGSRALIEFSHNPVEGLKVLPAVYMSIKMSQLKIPLQLDVHYPDDIKKELQHVTVTSMDSLRVNVDYLKQTVEPIEVSFGTSQLLKTIPSHLLSISVTEIVEVGHFWGYRIDEKNRSVLQTLTAELNYQNLTDLSVSPHPELVCLAPFTRLENTGYYRARILYVSGDFAEVFFVDYGDRSKVPLKKLKEIPSSLRELPFQQSHDLLKGFFFNGIVEEEKTSSREEEKDLIERLLKWFSDNKSDVPTHKVTVSGPFSPYEVKCHGMTRVSQFRNTVVRKGSINSVVVQDAPEHSSEQFLVAAFLSLNENGSTMFLEETSLMPPIPGLLALLSMLFAPAIELRVDKARKYFTGALCGLGWSQTCRAPLLPENDMELTFDVHFDVDDVLEINILRAAINKLLCECAVYSGKEKMPQLQESVRQLLLRLICKPRSGVVPKWYEKPYAWNQVDSHYIIDQSEKKHKRRDGLYQLHRLVMLNV